MEEKYLEIEQLLNAIVSNGRSYDIDKIKQAFLYAKELHDGQTRLSGEPYIMHPVSVAEILAGLGQMYVADERFKSNIDKHATGTAAFISAAIEAYCGK